jgi:hypothetical protein
VCKVNHFFAKKQHIYGKSAKKDKKRLQSNVGRKKIKAAVLKTAA